MVLSCTLPDNKIIEDLHSVLRNDSKSQKTRRQTLHNMMELVTQSKQLSSRDIVHKPKVDRAVFLQAFPRTPDRKAQEAGVAHNFRLYNSLMGRVFNSTSSQIKERKRRCRRWLHHVVCVPRSMLFCSWLFQHLQALFCSKPQTARILVYSDGPEAVVYNL